MLQAVSTSDNCIDAEYSLIAKPMKNYKTSLLVARCSYNYAILSTFILTSYQVPSSLIDAQPGVGGCNDTSNTKDQGT